MIKIILSMYWFVGMPLLLGMTWNKIKSEKNHKISTMYVEGYLIWLAVFFFGTFVEYRKFLNFSYWKTVRLWKLALVVLTVVCLVILNKTLIDRIKARLESLKTHAEGKGFMQRFCVPLACTLFLVLSIAFVVPSVQDTVIELGNFLISYDTLRAPTVDDIETLKEQGVDFGERENLFLELADKVEMTDFSFPEAYYMIPAGIFGVSLASAVHVAAAIGMLLFFFATYRTIAMHLYKDTTKQNIFVLFVLVFYFVMSIANVHLGVAVVQNIWNPMTLFVSCLLPLALAYSIKLALLKRGKALISWKGFRNAIILLCVMLSAQLMMDFGAGICSFLLLLSMALV